MRKKAKFKDFSSENKLILSFLYGSTALMAVMMAYTIKYDKENVGRFLFGTGVMASGSVFTHVHAKREAHSRLQKGKERD